MTGWLSSKIIAGRLIRSFTSFQSLLSRMSVRSSLIPAWTSRLLPNFAWMIWNENIQISQKIRYILWLFSSEWAKYDALTLHISLRSAFFSCAGCSITLSLLFGTDNPQLAETPWSPTFQANANIHIVQKAPYLDHSCHMH